MTAPSQKPASSPPDGGGMADSGTVGPVSGTVATGAVRGFGGLPSAAWSRIVVLFLALASIKIALLVGLGRHLGEIHWRLAGSRTNWRSEEHTSELQSL